MVRTSAATRASPAHRAALVLMIALGVAGCATGGWIESQTDAELPIDPPARGYPTALDRSAPALSTRTALPKSGRLNVGMPTAPATAPVNLAAADGQATRVAAAPASQEAASELHPALEQRRTDAPHALVTPLAIVPPQYRTQPANAQDSAAVAAPQSPLPASRASTPKAPVTAAISDAAEPVASAGVIGSSSSSSEADLAVTPASLSTNAKPTLAKARGELITAIESEIRERRNENSHDDQLPRLEQDLRLAYLAAGRLDDAVADIESLDESQREGYKQLMFGLGVWLSPDEARRAPLRTAKVLQSLREATTELSAGSKLELRKLAFCDRVESFGAYNEFHRNEFQPKQQVLLYVEVENFATERKSPSAYETELHGSYQILDPSGQIVAEKQLETDKETCRNHRRDYFLAYRITIPDGISPGRYRLELTIEDYKAKSKYPGRKFGEGMIEFTIRQ